MHSTGCCCQCCCQHSFKFLMQMWVLSSNASEQERQSVAEAVHIMKADVLVQDDCACRAHLLSPS